MKTKWVVKKYQSRVKKLMSEMRDAFTKEGFQTTEIAFCEGDDYRWTFFVGDLEKEQGVDISFQICESDAYEGTNEGINFCLNLVAYGGEVVGGFTPYNYTPQVWVNPRNKIAVDERFDLMLGCDVEGTVWVVNDFFTRKNWPKKAVAS